MPGFKKGANVRHPSYGQGTVRMDDGESVLVRFEHGVEECFPADLELIEGVSDRATTDKLDPALNVVTRVIGSCVLSVNDAWGVFSSSRIALLPHQLWVCKKVLESWPRRWMIADDVGLGKTVEAGLILTPLLSSGRVKRLLILTPASLTEQWQTRLREMFDIRVSMYASSIDTERSDFWNTHDKVVASAHTLRTNTGNRWERLAGADPWDLVIVDEAHHLNVDEIRGRTLSFQLAEHLQDHGQIHSMIFFTGTPHRGKDLGFLSLLKLLDPDEFDPKMPLEEQAHKLKKVMIRNNKARVTDMMGNPIFKPVRPHLEKYTYSEAETRFYEMLTDFIVTGKTYAANLGQQQQRMAIYVLITMQKLASSSVAAVRRALANRLERLQGAKRRLDQWNTDIKRMEELIAEDDPSNLDELAQIEERVSRNIDDMVSLNPNEIPAIAELLNKADEIEHETKIQRILDVVEKDYYGRAVLFFTEYKATQALLMSALKARYGDDCVTFINGDGFIEDVKSADGKVCTIKEDRFRAADRFNRGEVRFLVSTEAAGEGIDLQENCSTLIHVDLPWNPMRLHQRVGRLNRYGQKETVDVVTIRNPDTIESRIWECLDEKLERINLAFQGAMDDPEDMRQLVIGMASPRMFTELFADADPSLHGQRLEDWFDSKTATFGGEDAVRIVRNLFGNVARFDFGEVADQIPKVDLPDLIPLFKALFAVMGRRPNQTDEARLNFKTPLQWLTDFTIADRYNLLFARDLKPLNGEDVAGIGLKIVDRVISAAADLTEALAAVGDFPDPLVVFALRDRITGSKGPVRKVITGLQKKKDDGWVLLKDWEIIKLLNLYADKPRSQMFEAEPIPEQETTALIRDAQAHLSCRIEELDLPFQLPVIEEFACLVPGTPREKVPPGN